MRLYFGGSNVDICIYCRLPNTQPSAEHVIADALGGCIVLAAKDCCKPCNGVFDREIDRAVQDDLRPILAQKEVPGKRGEATQWTVTEIVDGQKRSFRINAAEIVAAEQRKLLVRTANTYTFRATSREELERACIEIEARNPGRIVEISPIVERAPELPDDRVDDVDFSAAHWPRWAAKTCLNVICYMLGRDVGLCPEFDDLRRLARGAPALVPADLTYGGIGSDAAEVDVLPPEHRISVRADPAGVRARVILFQFCGLTFARRMAGLPRVERLITMDAFEKRVVVDRKADV